MIGNDAIEFGQSGCRSKKPIHFAECDGSLCGPSVIGTVVEILESVCQLKCVLMFSLPLVASKRAPM